MSPSTLLVVFAFLFLWAGCSEEGVPPSEPSGQQDEVAEDGPAADSIEVVNDERSLERRIGDAAIATQVRIALVDARELRRFEFDPEVVNGQVFLRGEVNTQNQRSRAAAIAKDIQGVRSVTNEITALEEPTVAEQTPDTATADTATQDALAEVRDGQAGADDQATGSEGDPDQPADPASQPAQPQEEQATYHTVKSGESLWTISRNYDVTIDQIRRLNDLSSNNLRPGQRLRVK